MIGGSPKVQTSQPIWVGVVRQNPGDGDVQGCVLGRGVGIVHGVHREVINNLDHEDNPHWVGGVSLRTVRRCTTIAIIKDLRALILRIYHTIIVYNVQEKRVAAWLHFISHVEFVNGGPLRGGSHMLVIQVDSHLIVHRNPYGGRGYRGSGWDSELVPKPPFSHIVGSLDTIGLGQPSCTGDIRPVNTLNPRGNAVLPGANGAACAHQRRAASLRVILVPSSLAHQYQRRHQSYQQPPQLPSTPTHVLHHHLWEKLLSTPSTALVWDFGTRKALIGHLPLLSSLSEDNPSTPESI